MARRVLLFDMALTFFFGYFARITAADGWAGEGYLLTFRTCREGSGMCNCLGLRDEGAVCMRAYWGVERREGITMLVLGCVIGTA